MRRSCGQGRRIALTSVTDDWLVQRFEAAVGDSTDFCLVALGSHGRRELSPGSDLDLLLLHAGDHARAEQVANALWYPIWDAGLALDHSVRTVAESRRVASADLKVALGLLDGRPIAGAEHLGERLVESVLADWRAMAAGRLPALRELVEDRRRRLGDVASLVEPDVKASYGGLRDAGILRAITASWVTDTPHDRWPAAVETLLDVRDALHIVTARTSDVLRQQDQGAVADFLGLSGADALLRQVYDAARAVAFASDVTWYRVSRIAQPSASRIRRVVTRRGHDRVPLAEGVVLQSGEAVLALEADPRRDPVLVLRAAAAAAQAGVPLAPHAMQRLGRESGTLPVPWPRSAREAFISLLGAGSALPDVWEGLDQVGVIERLIPGWEVVRSAPQRDPMHRYTVDRHLVQTVVEAAALSRTVERPDLLLMAALLHDFGKARGGDHAERGAELAREVATRVGFDAEDAETVTRLVRWHLLLSETAMRRDLDDPATIDDVVSKVVRRGDLEVLHALTQVDARATGDGMWNDWRRSLVDDLVARCRSRMAGQDPTPPPELTADQRSLVQAGGVWTLVDDRGDDVQVTVAAPDRIGLLATIAGVLSMHRLQVRAARVMTVGDRAVQEWTVRPLYGQAPTADRFAEDVRRALDGSVDLRGRLEQRDAAYAPSGGFADPVVTVSTGDARRATTLEVRAHDAPALLFRICTSVAAAGASIHGAKVSTLGSEVIDVFFLTDRVGAPLSAEHAQAVCVAVQVSLGQSVT